MAKADAVPTSRSDIRRSAILATAWSVFVDQGYGGTSMARIAEQLGGSKATLYSYFSSKEDLFIAAARAKGQERYSALSEVPRQSEDLATDLGDYCSSVLEISLAEDHVAVYRLIVAEAVRFPSIGEAAFIDRQSRVLEPLARRIAAEMTAHRLRGADPLEAAEVLWDLCSVSAQRRALLAIGPRLVPREIRTLADRAVRIFLLAYGAAAAS